VKKEKSARWKEENEDSKIFFAFRKKFLLKGFFRLMKEKLVKILAPGVGWKEMAAHNRRRKDTSKHAVGV